MSFFWGIGNSKEENDGHVSLVVTFLGDGVTTNYETVPQFMRAVSYRRENGVVHKGQLKAEFLDLEGYEHKRTFQGEEELLQYCENEARPSWLSRMIQYGEKGNAPSSDVEKRNLAKDMAKELVDKERESSHSPALNLAWRTPKGEYFEAEFATVSEFVSDAVERRFKGNLDGIEVEATFTGVDGVEHHEVFATEQDLLDFCLDNDQPWFHNLGKLSPLSQEERNQVEEKEPEEEIPAPEGSLEQYLELVVGKAARSGKKGFKVTDKLEEVKRILEEQGSPYHLVRQSDHSWIFGQKDMEDRQGVLMVSTHADIVDHIKKPHSKLNHEKDYYRGTYDNAGTNAVCAHLMATEELPDNVYFAFTAEEETGRCTGAEDALSYVREVTGKEPIILALDVTDEGYESNRLFTVEGLHGVNESSRRKMLEVFLSTEGEEQSFEVVKLKKKDDNSFLPKEYRAEGLTVFDESVFYARSGCNSCSICLPGDGEMHGDSGFKVKRAVMEGYEASLLAAIYSFERANPEKVEELKARKDELVKEAKETTFWKERYFSNYSTPSYSTFGSSGGSTFYSHATSRDLYDGSFYDDYGEGLHRYSGYTPDYEEDYMFQQAVDDAYELAESYAEDEFEVFYGDIVAMYGIKKDDGSRAVFQGLFDECMEMRRAYADDELLDIDDVGVDM